MLLHSVAVIQYSSKHPKVYLLCCVPLRSLSETGVRSAFSSRINSPLLPAVKLYFGWSSVSEELDSMILVAPFPPGIFCDSDLSSEWQPSSLALSAYSHVLGCVSSPGVEQQCHLLTVMVPPCSQFSALLPLAFHEHWPQKLSSVLLISFCYCWELLEFSRYAKN